MSCVIDLYSGFLGCGKTTLINRLLDTEYAGRKVAIIENEIGKINIDAALLQKERVQVTKLTSGCVCCTLSGAFTEAVDLMVKAVHPDVIIIEPTGLADLASLLGACRRAKAARLRRLILVVNAKKLPALLTVVGDFYKDQIRAASCIYLNFTETMTTEEIQKTKGAILEINPRAIILDTKIAEVDEKTFAGSEQWPSQHTMSMDKPDRKPSSVSWKITSMDETNPVKMRMPGRNEEEVLNTWTMTFEGALTQEEYEALKKSLLDGSFGDIWRAKGILRLTQGEIRHIEMSFGDIFEEKMGTSEIEVTGNLLLIGKKIQKAIANHGGRSF